MKWIAFTSMSASLRPNHASSNIDAPHLVQKHQPKLSIHPSIRMKIPNTAKANRKNKERKLKSSRQSACIVICPQICKLQQQAYKQASIPTSSSTCELQPSKFRNRQTRTKDPTNASLKYTHDILREKGAKKVVPDLIPARSIQKKEGKGKKRALR